jgi:CheY-like chemotaxis protein
MAKAPRPIRILIVEDYADTRDLYVEFLSMQGHEVVAAEDGLQALHVARTVMPELIVLDINLPKLDGLSVLRRLRAEPRLDPIPVLTLSAAIGREYEEEALEAGAVRALHKPLLPDELHDAILEVIEGPQQPRAVASRWSR